MTFYFRPARFFSFPLPGPLETRPPACRKPGARAGPEFRPLRAYPAKANAYFQWNNYLYDECIHQGKVPFFVNLDETPVPLSFFGLRGNMVVEMQERPPRQRATRAQTRAYMTLVSCICDSPEVQPSMPHILVIGEKQLNLENLALIQAECPENVYVLRRKSGWNNIKIHTEILMLLARHLESVLGPERKVILSSDACKIHLASEVLGTMAVVDFWFVAIPPIMTWLLQPLDVCAFLKLKRYLKEQFMFRSEIDMSVAPVVSMCRWIFAAVRDVFDATDWSRAFDYTGARGDQSRVAKLLMDQLALEAPPVALRDRPSNELLASCWPRDLQPQWEYVYAALPALAALPPLPPPLAPPPPAALPAPVHAGVEDIAGSPAYAGSEPSEADHHVALPPLAAAPEADSQPAKRVRIRGKSEAG